ncbi:MAG: helix-turn-helix transcriptional regulator [Candidatus Zixiibacteriota bacterium]
MNSKTETKKNNLLKHYRLKRSLNKKDIAEFFGVDQSNQYYRWESGKVKPSLTNALKLSAFLKCPIEILFLEQFNQIRKEISQRRQLHFNIK